MTHIFSSVCFNVCAENKRVSREIVSLFFALLRSKTTFSPLDRREEEDLNKHPCLWSQNGNLMIVHYYQYTSTKTYLHNRLLATIFYVHTSTLTRPEHVLLVFPLSTQSHAGCSDPHRRTIRIYFYRVFSLCSWNLLIQRLIISVLVTAFPAVRRSLSLRHRKSTALHSPTCS